MMVMGLHRHCTDTAPTLLECPCKRVPEGAPALRRGCGGVLVHMVWGSAGAKVPVQMGGLE